MSPFISAQLGPARARHASVMTGGPEIHRQAARRHKQAADNHERAARFWEQQGVGEQAGLQRRLADYERQGADLERQWADVVDPKPAHRAESAAELGRNLAQKNAEHLSVELGRTAEQLDRAADIAGQRAVQREQAGLVEEAAAERRVADRAREFAQRARAQAAEWLKLAARDAE
jgi:hypothetical protein